MHIGVNHWIAVVRNCFLVLNSATGYPLQKQILRKQVAAIGKSISMQQNHLELQKNS